LDIPDCSLIIRFNKPQNFSSYMQSKGRARAKEGALFVILRDEFDPDTFATNKEEYRNYEEMEQVKIDFLLIYHTFIFSIQMLKKTFNTDCYIDSSSKTDTKRLKSYRPNKEIKIDAIRAIQILNE
jgi:superfamily II DNA helicase RecQ